MLECIVFSADFIEEGREFDEVEKIRATVYEDLKKGMLKIVEHTLKYLKSKGAEIDGAMLDCRSWLINTIGE